MITEQRAREIASWWQSPGSHGYRFAALASTGRILPNLMDDIIRELKELRLETDREQREYNQGALGSLLEYVYTNSEEIPK